VYLKAAVLGHLEAGTRSIGLERRFAGDLHFAGAGGDFHQFRCADVEGELAARHDYADSLAGAVRKKYRVRYAFAIKKYADLLIKENLIKEERKANLRYFKSNINNLFFKYIKIAFSINLILKSMLLDFLKQSLANVSSIVLFGSMAKGEDDRNSDVDLLIIGKEKPLNLEKFEMKLGKSITLHILSWSEWNKKAQEDMPFYSEIISQGVTLYGELPLVKWK